MSKTKEQNSKFTQVVDVMEAWREELDLSIEEIAEKLEAKPENYSKWAKGEEDPPGKKLTNIIELPVVLSQEYPYCPTKNIILGMDLELYLKADQTCPVCDDDNCDWEFKPFSDLFDFEQIKGPDGKKRYYWIKDDRLIMDYSQSEVEGTLIRKDSLHGKSLVP